MADSNKADNERKKAFATLFRSIIIIIILFAWNRWEWSKTSFFIRWCYFILSLKRLLTRNETNTSSKTLNFCSESCFVYVFCLKLAEKRPLNGNEIRRGGRKRKSDRATEKWRRERRFQQLCSITNAIVVDPLSSDPGRATVRASGRDGGFLCSLSFNYNTELPD